MFREKYRSMTDKIDPEGEIVNKIISLVYMDRAESGKRKSFFSKPAIISAVILVVFLTLTPVLAANVPFVYEFMYYISPSAAQFFMPVRKSCVDNGIRMEVVSAYIHESKAEIYVTMQDITGNRIDGTIDLFDSYSVNSSFNSSAVCRLADYDESTGKATFYIMITQWGDRKIEGEKITFSVREFISNRRVYEEIPVETVLSCTEKTPYTKLVYPGDGTGREFPGISEKYNGKVKVLAMPEPMDFPAEGVNLTGIGYVDGMLHVQASLEGPADFGYFFLRDESGKEIQCDYYYSFREDGENNTVTRYYEYVFDIPETEIGI